MTSPTYRLSADHPADRLSNFILQARDRSRSGTLTADHMDKINELLGVLSLKNTYGSIMVGLVKNVPEVDIGPVVRYLEEKEPLLLGNLVDHPKFDKKRLVNAVLASKTSEDFLSRLTRFYGGSQNLPSEIQEDLVDRLETWARRKLAMSGTTGQNVTIDDADLMQAFYGRRSAIKEESLLDSMVVTARRIFRLSQRNPELSRLPMSFIEDVTKWSWSLQHNFRSEPMRLEAQVMMLHHFSDSKEMKEWMMENYPEAGAEIVDTMGASPDKVHDRVLSLLAQPMGLGHIYKDPSESVQKDLDLSLGTPGPA